VVATCSILGVGEPLGRCATVNWSGAADGGREGRRESPRSSHTIGQETPGSALQLPAVSGSRQEVLRSPSVQLRPERGQAGEPEPVLAGPWTGSQKLKASITTHFCSG